jgi:hypothetical protein
MNNNKITNVGNPTDDKDSTNKKYVDERVESELRTKLQQSEINNIESKRFLEYNSIVTLLKPKFWFSSFFPEVFNKGVREQSKTNIIQNVQTSFICSARSKFTSKDYVISEYEFGQEYTFIGVVKRITQGRVFTSLTGNKFFGFWKTFMNVVWHDGAINMSGTSSTEDIQIFIYLAKDSKKKLYNNNTLIFEKDTVTNAWGNLVIGDTMLQEGAEFELYDCIGFDRILTDKEINRVRSIIKI